MTTLQSGVPPYDYDFGVPFHAAGVVGLSGILLEQAQFVIQAEIRKFGLTIFQDFNLYTHGSAVSPSGRYEPKTDGSTLGNFVNPGQATIIDHILETRDALLNLFEEYAGDSGRTREEHFTDWIQQAYPNSPSGYARVPSSEEIEANFLHPQLGVQTRAFLGGGTPQPGPIETSDTHWLGGSGTFFDIDFGEVIFNPYPYTRASGTINAYALGDSAIWPLQAEPFFPAFQQPNGNIISANGLEVEDGIDPKLLSANAFNNQSLLYAYPIGLNTEIFLGQGGSDFSSVSDFTIASIQTRDTGLYSPNTDGAAAIINPSAQTSGVYKTLIKNSRTNFLNTAVESGQISKTPPDNAPGGIWHVLADCIWVGDLRGSGMSPVSPYNGDLLWLRQGGPNGNSRTWDDPDQLGLERIGGVLQRLDDVVGTNDNEYHSYNDDLTYNGTSIASDQNGQSFSTLGIPIDFTHNGTNYYDLRRPVIFVPGQIVVINGSTLIWDRVIRMTHTGNATSANGIFAMPSTGRTYIYNGPAVSGNMNIVEFSSGPIIPGFEPDPIHSIEVEIPKRVSVPFNFNLGIILDVVEITGAANFNDGVWALVSRTLPFSQRNLHLMRIEEDTTTWNVLENVHIANAAINGQPTPSILAHIVVS